MWLVSVWISYLKKLIFLSVFKFFRSNEVLCLKCMELRSYSILMYSVSKYKQLNSWLALPFSLSLFLCLSTQQFSVMCVSECLCVLVYFTCTVNEFCCHDKNQPIHWSFCYGYSRKTNTLYHH